MFHHGIHWMVALVIGVILGAQLGAWLSRRVHDDWIIRGLAVALCLAGIRLLGWPGGEASLNLQITQTTWRVREAH